MNNTLFVLLDTVNNNIIGRSSQPKGLEPILNSFLACQKANLGESYPSRYVIRRKDDV